MTVRVDMGVPAFRPEEVPVAVGGEDALHTKIDIDSSAATSGGRVPNGGTELGVEPHVVEAACLSMGNPHAVVFVDDPASAPETTLGPALERHQLFPHRVNVEFVRVDAPDHVTMRVWERGSGETLACGTGACAAAVAARLLAGGAPQTTVFLRGGSVEISWDGGLGVPAPVVMTGSAAETYRGEFDLEAYG